jgi:hypothetical protein
MVEAELIVETDTRELTVSVEKEPVPGAFLLILDTVSVETEMVLPINVEYIAIGAVICVVSVRVLPVRVDNAS